MQTVIRSPRGTVGRSASSSESLRLRPALALWDLTSASSRPLSLPGCLQRDASNVARGRRDHRQDRQGDPGELSHQDAEPATLRWHWLPMAETLPPERPGSTPLSSSDSSTAAMALAPFFLDHLLTAFTLPASTGGLLTALALLLCTHSLRCLATVW
jgi:hypothetical protein